MLSILLALLLVVPRVVPTVVPTTDHPPSTTDQLIPDPGNTSLFLGIYCVGFRMTAESYVKSVDANPNVLECVRNTMGCKSNYTMMDVVYNAPCKKRKRTQDDVTQYACFGTYLGYNTTTFHESLLNQFSAMWDIISKVVGVVDTCKSTTVKTP